MSKPGEGVEDIPPPPKGDGSNGKTTPSMEHQGTPEWSNSPSSLSNSSSKEKLTSSRESSRSLKAVKWLLPLHQIKKPMLHPKKKQRTRNRKREIRDLITILYITMIICLTLTPSLRYLLVNPLVSMGHTTPNGDT
jgi:hypothetical protein